MDTAENLMVKIEKLEPLEQEILNLRFNKGLTAEETSLYFNVPRARIVNMEKKIMEKLKTKLD